MEIENLDELCRLGALGVGCPECDQPASKRCIGSSLSHRRRVLKSYARRRRVVFESTKEMLDTFKDRIPGGDWSDIKDSAVAADWGDALDELLACLVQRHAPVTSAERDQLTVLVLAMNRISRHWLGKLTIEDPPP